MRKLTAILCLTVAILLGSVGVRSARAAIYECEVMGIYDFRDGEIGPSDAAEYWLNIITMVTFDDLTGVLKYGNTVSTNEILMRVHQRGSRSNSAIGIVAEPGIMRNPLNSIRIQTWQDPVPFIWDNEGELFTGTCQISPF